MWTVDSTLHAGLVRPSLCVSAAPDQPVVAAEAEPDASSELAAQPPNPAVADWYWPKADGQAPRVFLYLRLVAVSQACHLLLARAAANVAGSSVSHSEPQAASKGGTWMSQVTQVAASVSLGSQEEGFVAQPLVSASACSGAALPMGTRASQCTGTALGQRLCYAPEQRQQRLRTRVSRLELALMRIRRCQLSTADAQGLLRLRFAAASSRVPRSRCLQLVAVVENKLAGTSEVVLDHHDHASWPRPQSLDPGAQENVSGQVAPLHLYEHQPERLEMTLAVQLRCSPPAKIALIQSLETRCAQLLHHAVMASAGEPD